MKLVAVALAALSAASGCAPDRDAPATVEATRYRVELGTGGDGVVELGPGDRACITLDTPLPKAAHLHRRSRAGPADTILVTFFEPPAPARERTCIEDADPRARDFVAGHTGKVYVDLHYNPRDEGVIGRLTPGS